MGQNRAETGLGTTNGESGESDWLEKGWQAVGGRKRETPRGAEALRVSIIVNWCERSGRRERLTDGGSGFVLRRVIVELDGGLWSRVAQRLLHHINRNATLAQVHS